jgi:hypothetical protein
VSRYSQVPRSNGMAATPGMIAMPSSIVSNLASLAPRCCPHVQPGTAAILYDASVE